MKWGGYQPARHYSFLPPEIWNMPQLRHLIFFYSFELPQLPAGGGASPPPLEKLQTLSQVTSLVCRKRVLRLFPNLKKLGLVYHRSQNYRLRNLRRLRHLEKLKVSVDHSCSLQGQIENVFPDTLRRLTLVGGGLPWEDMTAAIASLPNLQVLKLKDCACDGGTWETGEEQFPQLKFLLLQELNLEYWITESTHFPRLECLVVRGCRFLGEIPQDVGEISTLQLIEVHRVNKSVVESAKQILEDQRDLGNDLLQVRFY